MEPGGPQRPAIDRYRPGPRTPRSLPLRSPLLQPLPVWRRPARGEAPCVRSRAELSADKKEFGFDSGRFTRIAFRQSSRSVRRGPKSLGRASALWNDRGTDHTDPLSPPNPGTTVGSNLFRAGFRFRSVTGAAQSNMSLTIWLFSTDRRGRASAALIGGGPCDPAARIDRPRLPAVRGSRAR